MPQYDIAMLITVNISIAFLSIFVAVTGLVILARQNIRSQEIAERIDLRLRRQYADIDRELQEIKERLR